MLNPDIKTSGPSWATPQENLSLGRPAQLQRLARVEILDLESKGIILSRQQTTKTLSRLRGCAGWSAPLLFAYGKSRISNDAAQLYPACTTCQATCQLQQDENFNNSVFGLRQNEVIIRTWVDCVLICGLSSKLGQSAEFLGCKDVNVCREEAGEVMLPCAFEPYDPRTGKENQQNFVEFSLPTVNEPRHEKTCLCHMRTIKVPISLRGSCSLISAFVLRFLDSIIPLVSISKIASL